MPFVLFALSLFMGLYALLRQVLDAYLYALVFIHNEEFLN